MAIKAQSKGDTLDLELFGVVGEGWSEDGIVASAVKRKLREAGDVSTINLKLSSVGGLVDEGLEIYQMLADHPAKVICTVGSVAISCGSLIAIAADERILHASSIWCAHNPWRLTVGDYKATERAAQELRMMANVFATAYSAQTGKSVEEIQALMDEDRCIDANEALALGFATKVLEPKKKAVASGSLKLVARSEFEAMRNDAQQRFQRMAALTLCGPEAQPEQPIDISVEASVARARLGYRLQSEVG